MFEEFRKLRKLLELCFDVRDSAFLDWDFKIEEKQFMIYSSVQTNQIHIYKVMFFYKGKDMMPLRKGLTNFAFQEEPFFLPKPDVCYELISLKMTFPSEIFKKILQLL